MAEKDPTDERSLTERLADQLKGAKTRLKIPLDPTTAGRKLGLKITDEESKVLENATILDKLIPPPEAEGIQDITTGKGSFVDTNTGEVGFTEEESLRMTFDIIEAGAKDTQEQRFIRKLRGDTLRGFSPTVKQILMDRVISQARAKDVIERHRPITKAELGSALVNNISEFSAGIHQLVTAATLDIYGMVSGESFYNEAVSSADEPEPAPKTPEEVERQIMRGQVRGEIFVDEDGNPQLIPKRASVDSIVKQGIIQAFKPHTEAFKAIRAGDNREAALIMKDHYRENPLDFILDASMVLAITGGGLRVAGGTMRAMARAGAQSGARQTLKASGEIMLAMSDYLDPLMVSAKMGAAVTRGLATTRLGRALIRITGARKIVNKIFRVAAQETRVLMARDAKKLREIFGNLSSQKGEVVGELQQFVAVVEGRASVVRPSEEFLTALQEYRKLIDAETEFLLGERLLSAQRIREVAYQPMMSASTHTMEDLMAVADEIAQLGDEVADTLRAVQKEVGEAAPVSSEVSKAVREGRIVGPDTPSAAKTDIDALASRPAAPETEKAIAARVAESVDTPKTVSDVRKTFQDAAESQPTGKGVRLADDGAADADSMVHLAEIDPVQTGLLNEVQKDIKALTNYIERIRKNVPGTKPTKIPRAALLEESRQTMQRLENKSSEASASLRPATAEGESIFPSGERTLTFQEIGEKSGIPAETLTDARDLLKEVGFTESDSRAMLEITVRHSDVEAGSVTQFIDEAAERKARQVYPDFDDIDPDTQQIIIQGYSFEAKEIIKDLRAPIEAGKRARPAKAMGDELVSEIFKMLRVGRDLDQLPRAESYIKKVLEANKLSPNLLRRGQTKLKKHIKHERRASITGMHEQERLKLMADAEAILHERRLQAKRIREGIESRKGGLQPTYNSGGYIDDSADSVILLNMEKDVNDTVNMHSYAPGTLDPAYSRGGTDITQAQREQMLIDSANLSSNVGIQRTRAMDFSRREIGTLQDEIDVLVKSQAAYRLPLSLQGPTGTLIDPRKFKAFTEKLRADIASTIKTKGEAGRLQAELAELSRRRSEFNAAGTQIIKARRQMNRAKKRLQALRRGANPNASDLESLNRSAETGPSSNVADNLSPDEFEAAVERQKGELVGRIEQDARDIRRLEAELEDLTRQIRDEGLGDRPAARQAMTRQRDFAEQRLNKRRRKLQDLNDNPPKQRPRDSEAEPGPRASEPEVRGPKTDESVPREPQARVPAEETTKVPFVLKDTMKAGVATPRRILGALSAMVRNDSRVLEAFKKLRDFVVGRNLDIGLQRNGLFEINKISSLMAEMKVPKEVRVKVQRILKGFNDTRPRVVGDIEPFIAELILDKSPLSAADLVRISTTKSLEGKLTRPVYFPHLFEETRNILDARASANSGFFRDILAESQVRFDRKVGRGIESTLQDEIEQTMRHKGFTGYYDESGKFHRVTKGQGARAFIGGIIGRQIKPIMTRPSFLKRRTGAWGYIDTDPERVLRIHRMEMQRFLRNRTVVKRLNESGLVKEWDGTKEGILEGHVPVNFEGALQFYEQTMNFRKVFASAVDKTKYAGDEIMRDAILAHLPKLKRVLAVGAKPGQYKQVPKAVATAIRHNMAVDLPPAWLKFIDVPTNFWRGLTLAASPRWYLNNIIGNMYLSMLSGVGSMRFIVGKMKMFDEFMPDELGTTGLIMSEASESAMRWSSARAWDRFYGWNSAIENRFRKAVYTNDAIKQARKQGMKNVGFKLFRSQQDLTDILSKVKANPQMREKAIETVNEFLFDYSKLDPIERMVVRRILPFWTWYKNIAKFSYLLPIKHPKRAWVLGKLGMIGHEAVQSQFDHLGIEFDDLPEYMKGRVILNYNLSGPFADPENPDVAFISNQGQNPFNDVLNVPGVIGGLTGAGAPSGEARLPGLNPFLKVFIEQKTGVDSLSGRPFSDPDTFSSFDGSRVYDDPETGERIKNVNPAPPILEHIMRQTPQWQMIKDWSYAIRGMKLGAQHGTNTILDPKWIIDELTGEPKYPRSVILSTMKLVGLQQAWIQDLAKYRKRIGLVDKSVTGQAFNSRLRDDPDFKDKMFEQLDLLMREGPTEEEMQKAISDGLKGGG